MTSSGLTKRKRTTFTVVGFAFAEKYFTTALDFCFPASEYIFFEWYTMRIWAIVDFPKVKQICRRGRSRKIVFAHDRLPIRND